MQELEAVLDGPGVGLEVEEQVAGRRFGERGQALAGLVLVRRDELAADDAVTVLLLLQASLLTQPVERSGDEVLLPLSRRECRELAERGHLRGHETLGLESADARDAAQVVVVATTGRAVQPPPADVAVLDRVGVGVGRLAFAEDARFEAALDLAVVGAVVGQAVRVEAAVAGDHVHTVGRHLLQGLQPVGVNAQLEKCGGFDSFGELRVRGLVAPWAEGAGLVDPDQEVGVTAPATSEQRALVDDADGPRSSLLVFRLRLPRSTRRSCRAARSRGSNGLRCGAARGSGLRAHGRASEAARAVGRRGTRALAFVLLPPPGRGPVRCSQPRKPTRSLALTIRRPSRRCISFRAA